MNGGPKIRISGRLGAGALMLLTGVPACGDGVNDPQPTGPSSVSFSYQGQGEEGSISGSYQVEGDPDLSVPSGRQTYAEGRRIRSAGALQVDTNRQRSNDYDFARVTLPRLSTGSWATDRPCGTDYCPEIFIALELRRVHGSQARYSCTLESGIVRITSISGTRARGGFSGTGICLGAPGVADLEHFSVSNGRFDVKLRDVQS